MLVETNLSAATLSGCRIHGISVWDVKLDEETKQSSLAITRVDQSTIEVDSLEVAQFIYLLLNNQKIRDVINTITSKVVLILGNFSPDRKAALDRIREGVRERGYLPVLFDFENSQSKDLDETVLTLAHMARFVFADITDARSVPHELRAFVQDLGVPVQTLILSSQLHYATVEGFYKYPWFQKIYRYDDLESLTSSLDKLIDECEATIVSVTALKKR
jgi:hypothetical protein